MRPPTSYLSIDDEVIDMHDPSLVIEPLLHKVNMYGTKEQYDQDMKQFSEPQKAVFTVWWYVNEVILGGHFQFYDYSTGMVWEDAIQGFHILGLPEGAEILEESVRRFAEKPGFLREERLPLLKDMEEAFFDLDKKLLELDNRVVIYDRMMDYINAGREAFYFEGEVEERNGWP
jgi:hypothetical protein